MFFRISKEIYICYFGEMAKETRKYALVECLYYQITVKGDAIRGLLFLFLA